jgi:hypothetical protein
MRNHEYVTIEGQRDSVKEKGKLHAVAVHLFIFDSISSNIMVWIADSLRSLIRNDPFPIDPNASF